MQLTNCILLFFSVLLSWSTILPEMFWYLLSNLDQVSKLPIHILYLPLELRLLRREELGYQQTDLILPLSPSYIYVVFVCVCSMIRGERAGKTPATFVCLSQARTWISKCHMSWSFLCSVTWGEKSLFVDIGGIVDHRCLNLFFS